ncbi:MAG: aspartate aminotransferase family protein [Chloroflexi bacterium]|nr:aspartate aminotransferase family protein [Chloroflexota bacterium]
MSNGKKVGEVRELPGRKSAELLDLRNEYIPKAMFQVIPLFIARGKGALVIDVDGNEYIDFAAGIAVLNTGHCHDKVVTAIQRQADKYLHTAFNVLMYEPYVKLAKKLAEITPGSFPKQVVLKNSGSEAIEDAIKIARTYTGKKGIICFEGAFHGRTQIAAALTSQVKNYKFGFGPFDPYIYRFPYAYGYRAPFGLNDVEYAEYCVNRIEDSFKSYIAPEETAAIIFEPILGEGGYIIPPAEFVKGLRRLCDTYNLVLIADEVQSGMGRTGKMWAIEHFNVIPDIVVTSKGLGGGTVIAASVFRKEMTEKFGVGGLGGTLGGNPVSCAAALAAIEAIEQENLLDRATKFGKIAKTRLDDMKKSYKLIGDVRGVGLSIGIEFVTNRETKEPAAKETAEIIKKCHSRGLITMSCGALKNIIRLMPPLVIKDDELQKGLDILEAAIKEINEAI